MIWYNPKFNIDEILVAALANSQIQLGMSLVAAALAGLPEDRIHGKNEGSAFSVVKK